MYGSSARQNVHASFPERSATGWCRIPSEIREYRRKLPLGTVKFLGADDYISHGRRSSFSDLFSFKMKGSLLRSWNVTPGREVHGTLRGLRSLRPTEINLNSFSYHCRIAPEAPNHVRTMFSAVRLQESPALKIFVWRERIADRKDEGRRLRPDRPDESILPSTEWIGHCEKIFHLEKTSSQMSLRETSVP